MTYCSSIAFTRLSFGQDSSSAHKIGHFRFLGRRRSQGQVLKLSWISLLLLGVNFVLAVIYAVLINQASISGYRLAELETQKVLLSQNNSRMEVQLAASRAAGKSTSFLPGFEPVASVEYVGPNLPLTLR